MERLGAPHAHAPPSRGLHVRPHRALRRPARRARDPVGELARALQPDRDRRRCARARVGRGGSQLPQVERAQPGPRAPRGRSHRDPRGHGQRRHRGQLQGLRAVEGPRRAARHRRARLARDRLLLPHRVGLPRRRRRRRRGPPGAVPHRLRRLRPRPRPALLRRRPRRRVVVQRRQRRAAPRAGRARPLAALGLDLQRRRTGARRQPTGLGVRRWSRVDGRPRTARAARWNAARGALAQLPQQLRARARLIRQRVPDRQRRRPAGVAHAVVPRGWRPRLLLAGWLAAVERGPAPRAGHARRPLARRRSRRRHERLRARARRTDRAGGLRGHAAAAVRGLDPRRGRRGQRGVRAPAARARSGRRARARDVPAAEAGRQRSPALPAERCGRRARRLGVRCRLVRPGRRRARDGGYAGLRAHPAHLEPVVARRQPAPRVRARRVVPRGAPEPGDERALAGVRDARRVR